MAVSRRRTTAVPQEGLTCIGAVRSPERVVAAFAAGTEPDTIRRAFDAPVSLKQVGRGLLATFPASTLLPGDDAETELLKGQNVLVAIRNGETAEAAAKWLAYHQTQHGADAALILDRDPPDQAGFADTLTALGPSLPAVVVSMERPLGQPDADPWHSALGELTVVELLRHRFLAEVRAVAFLGIADLALPGAVSVFDRAVDAPGRYLPLEGREIYPWRLRQGRPAPFGDHIAQRRNERRQLRSWAAAPGSLPEQARWKPGRPLGVSPAEDAMPFRRAMGVSFPGTPVNKLVRKADLAEDPMLVELVMRVFAAAPIRLPSKGVIPPRPATARVTVVTAMKNEGPFILDWIAHNRAIGIDRHLVYTNDCSDGTELLLDLLSEAGVTRRDNPYRALGKVPQHGAFRAAESEAAVTEADWLLTLDVDEYINIHVGDGRIADLLAAVPEAHVISMPWRLFGNGDAHRFEDRPVTAQFTCCAPLYAPRPIQAWAFKSLFRNAELFRRLGVHRPKGLEASIANQLIWVDGSGGDLPPSVWRTAWRMSKGHWGYDLVTLNHYAARSAESFLVKRDRGRVNHTTRDQGEAYWFKMNQNAEEDRSIQRFAVRAADEKAALLALPGVAEAHDTSVAWHKRRAAELRAHPDHAALYRSITSPRMERLSRMATRFGANVYIAGPHVIPDEIVARDPAEAFFFSIDAPTG